MRDAYNRDGHRLVVILGPDWTIKPDILCEPSTCTARWHDGAKPAEAPDCWLQYMAVEFGSEFLEWWCASQGGFTSEVRLERPIEIEWSAWGDGEDGETYWRPVDPDEDEVPASPECLKAAA